MQTNSIQTNNANRLGFSGFPFLRKTETFLIESQDSDVFFKAGKTIFDNKLKMKTESTIVTEGLQIVAKGAKKVLAEYEELCKKAGIPIKRLENQK